MILSRMFEKQDVGFYVDIGAHHPMRFSNTYYFYKKGWSGINIDAAPGSMKSFRKLRRRDINIEAAIGLGDKESTYYVFNEPALNSFDKKLSEMRHSQNGPFKIERTIQLRTRPLSSVLEEYLSGEVCIDFMSVDVEGRDLDVLMSNDWARFRPSVILVELLESELTGLTDNQIAKFLVAQGYHLYAKTVNTVIFRLP